MISTNIVHFARLLRRAGVPVGTDRVLLALQAVPIAGLASRADLHATLQCCLIDRAEHRRVFDQAFHLFWKDPDLLGQMLRLLLPSVTERAAGAIQPENRRLSEAFGGTLPQPNSDPPERIELDAQMSWSEREALRQADFDTMSSAEWQAARRLLGEIEPFFARLRTRRAQTATRGARVDLRAALRAAGRRGGEIVELPRRQQRTRPEPLVMLLDISGSMSRYSRMFLHFMHAMVGGRRAADYRVEAFVFGTRLTHITRPLRVQDPDDAIASVMASVQDWSGGTRIAQALHQFNLRWARRVLSGSPTVLLVSDGLEHAELNLLAHQAERLSKSCRRLIWLNPLLRYDAFEPRARGIRAIMPHVDAFLPVHNVDSLAALAQVLLQANLASRPPRASAMLGRAGTAARRAEHRFAA